MHARRTMPALLLLIAACLAGCATTEQPLPAGKAQLPSPRYDYQTYWVKKGDTLSSVGRAFDVPWQKIQEANQCNPNSLQVGQLLLIPVHARGTAGPPEQYREAPPMKPAGTSASEPVKNVPRELLHKGRPASPYWWPTAGEVARKFGESVRGFAEPGIGVSAAAGTEVCAAAQGTVICVTHCDPSSARGWGDVVVIRHAGGVVTWYGQLDEITVKQGQTVEKGERIGTVGATGAATQAELTFRVFKNDRPEDPLKYLP